MWWRTHGRTKTGYWLINYFLFPGSSTGRRGMRGCSQSITVPLSSSFLLTLFLCSHHLYLQPGLSTSWNFLQEISSCSGRGTCSHPTAAKTLPLKPSTSGNENLGKYWVTESWNLRGNSHIIFCAVSPGIYPETRYILELTRAVVGD